MFGAHDPWPFIYDLHRGLLSGLPGRVLISMVGVGLWLMVVSGLKSFVRIKGRKPSIHAMLGIFLGVPIASVAGLGAVLNFVEPLSNWLDPIPSVASVDTLSRSAPIEIEAEVASVRQVVGKIKPELDLVRIYPPKDGRPYQIFYYRDNTRIYVDPGSKAILKVRTSWSHWTSALLPLHSLKPIGAFGSGLIFILGLSLVFLTSRGLISIIRNAASNMKNISSF
jgi:uncharacterized iron-regulated membrane protein